MANNDSVNSPVMSSRPLITPASRFEKRLTEPIVPPAHEEVLIVDDRAALRPAQVVESKLTKLLEEASLPVSHLQMRGLLRTRK